MTVSRALPGLAPIVALALLLTACGSDDEAEASGARPTLPPSALPPSTSPTSTSPPAADDTAESPDDGTSDAQTDAANADGADTDENSARSAAAAAPAPPVPDALDFTAVTVDGSTFDGADLAGRPVLLWFWAPWCTVCAREAPSVAQLADDLEGQVEVVGVAGLSSDTSAMATFVERGGLEDLVHVADTDGSIYTRFGVVSQYDSVTVSPDGEVTVLTGPLSEADLRGAAERLVG